MSFLVRNDISAPFRTIGPTGSLLAAPAGALSVGACLPSFSALRLSASLSFSYSQKRDQLGEYNEL